MWELAALSSREMRMVTTFAYALFGILSAHFVLVALWLAVAQHGHAPLFGQWEELSGLKLVVWAALLSFCGVSGLLVLATESEQAAQHAVVCWLLLSALHAWCLLTVEVSRNGLHSWTISEMVVQLLTDVMSVGFLTWKLRQSHHCAIVGGELIRQPLLPVRNVAGD
ncbi:hypothetical protein PHYPSEUDO_009024 [Phytophthora pseudosyringae]|uniref:Transmembrane protein n=1 Tax=Phytophthora pseudosyringae TaxID=221518 RepID=A0A8T1VDV0_9STRA|nr:hypothetical protein PHYPSEUDO_009024 [Phytophthora pseudosyringae]